MAQEAKRIRYYVEPSRGLGEIVGYYVNSNVGGIVSCEKYFSAKETSADVAKLLAYERAKVLNALYTS